MGSGLRSRESATRAHASVLWGEITEVVAYLSYDWPITAKFKKVVCRQDNLSSGSV
jgi:hypothetical protein